ncbi:MAG: hypothetical protein JNL58_01260 [Planctomyces sp.]|nr:hypothetical protein [Planctomyces sp.]
MSTLGKVCLVLTILALIGGAILGGMLGGTANSWAVKLRDAKEKSKKEIESAEKSYADLRAAEAELARKKLGWGYEWTFAGDGSIQITQATGELTIRGLGKANGLTVGQTTTENGQQVPVIPIVHVFAPSNDNTSVVYIGEFRANVNLLGDTDCVLVPTWTPNPQEVAGWNMTGMGARLRSIVPPTERAEIDGLVQTIIRGMNSRNQLDASIKSQTALYQAAVQQREVRKGELLGNEDVPLIEDRPEFRIGLLKALENLEEERNGVQVAVDTLRRMIKTEADKRSETLGQLQELAEKLPEPSSRVSKRQD